MGNQYKAYFRPRNPATKVLWPAGRVSNYGEPFVINVLMGGFHEAMTILLASGMADHLVAGDTVVLLNTDEHGGLRVFKLEQPEPIEPPLTWVQA